MKVLLLVFAVLGVAISDLTKENKVKLCKTTMKQLTEFHNIGDTTEKVEYLTNLYNNLGCESALEVQETGWVDGERKRCWRQGCMICSEEEVYAKCLPSPKQRCLKHSLCGDYGEGNSCIFIHSPAYYECLKTAPF
eukprot:TRINITY_DN5851_c0_g2_i2.p1 TRINITY_DN5851_c0_g2~~TRINITY_DN5851_c0_g2_i2.p1  ORF type:complete len:136 (-),score=9.05 TRINITY_DN5851_c0_g2_i2:147-554(-)